MKFSVAVDPGMQKAVAAGAATTSGLAWVWASAKEVALELFGVPLQVLLAAVVGAFLARTFQSSIGYLRALGGSVAWAIAGTILAQLVLALVGAWVDKEISTGALSGVAFLISGGGQFLAPVIVKEAPEALKRWLRAIGSKE